MSATDLTDWLSLTSIRLDGSSDTLVYAGSASGLVLRNRTVRNAQERGVFANSALNDVEDVIERSIEGRLRE